MGALKVVGGILALAGGVLVFIAWITLIGIGMDFLSLFSLVNLVAIILSIIGGILGIAGKRAGGGLALVGALIWILGIILIYIDPMTFLFMLPMSWLGGYIPVDIIISWESLIVLLGSIFILAGGSE
ncbi:MAG: hypothetical protein EU536_02565 [Promethearchaeota archaeon]|nr:MAG: hypothetical protein EU536_02565 [Candidatus Lokiarchaeota archaeon]